MAASPGLFRLYIASMILPHDDELPPCDAIPNGWFKPNDKLANKKKHHKGAFSVGWKTGEETEQKSAQIYYMFINHRSEILSMKEQVQMIKGLLAA